MASVKSQKEDVPHDLQNPLFRFGFGLSYQAARPKCGDCKNMGTSRILFLAIGRLGKLG
jgi:hypothetical protein